MKIRNLTCVVTLCSLIITPVAADWVKLFDGKTLEGWKKVGGTGEFKVENGCIVGYGEDIKGNTFLRTEREFADFELNLKVKFDHYEGNSGVMYRAQQKATGEVYGYQCELDHEKKRSWTAGLYEEGRRGWLFPKKDPAHASHAAWFTAEGQTAFRWEDWNQITIRCQGNHLQTWVNGVKRTDFVDAELEMALKSGFIGLQVHQGKRCQVRWKDLEIKELNP